MADTVEVPRGLWQRVTRVLDAIEPLLLEQNAKWVDSGTARKLLACTRTKLWELSSKGKIKRTNTGKGRNVQYSRKSIEQYLESNANK